MQVTRRHLAPAELDHELLWLSVSLVSLSLAAVWLTIGLPWPRCIFHEITGLPCVSCGMTRCGIQFFHGHFLDALKWNPLVFAFLCGVTVYDLYAVTTLTIRAPRLRICFYGSGAKRFGRLLVISAFVLNWIYLLVHWRNFEL
jgi:Protein of unknown function (DUF2752)